MWKFINSDTTGFFLSLVGLALCLIARPTWAQYGGGLGDANDPHLIYSAEQLNAVGEHPDHWNRHFKLMADIDLRDLSVDFFNVIGNPGLYSPLGVALDSENQKLYWTEAGIGKIQRANLDGSDIEDVVSNLSTPFGIALDPVGGKLYWTDLGTDKIQRANLDGSELQDIIASGLGTPRGLALAGDKIVWTDSGRRHVSRANLDGSGVEILVDLGLDRPMGIAVDITGGKLYWADADTGKIQRANLDGSHVVDLVSTGLDRPTGIALDVVNQRIYWSDWGSDKIQSMDWDGANIRDLVTTDLMTPYLMVVDSPRGQLYWADRDTVKIQRFDLKELHVHDVIIQNPPFSGVLDGNGKAISHFGLSSNGLSKIGLFGHVEGPEAQIRDLELIEPVVSAGGAGSIGILVGQLDEGTIQNCHIREGVLNSSGDAGGLVGDNLGVVKACSVTIAATGAHGLVARNSGDVIDCHVAGDIIRGSGLAGSNDGKIKGCSAHVHVDRGSGLVGTNTGMITSSHVWGDIQGRSNLGGLVGINRGIVTFSFADVQIHGTGKEIGGVAGRNEEVVAHCYGRGGVSGKEKVGGLVGLNEGRIIRCYAANAVAGEANVGGLVGDGNDLSQSFWDRETSGQAVSPGGTGYGTAEMQSETIYSAAGWDFVGPNDGPSDIWALPADGGYPILWWQLDRLPALPSFASGSGSEEDPYVIATVEHLNSIGSNPRLMESQFMLMDDVDLSGIPFYPIGSDVMPYAGHFMGNNHHIANLSLRRVRESHVGLFGALAGPESQITDLCLIRPEVAVEDGDAVGALVGEVFQGTIANCFVKQGTVHANNEVGGVIGRSLDASVTRCSFSGTVDGGVCIGGVIGSLERGMIHDCASDCNVVGQETVGGFVGKNAGGDIQRCDVTGRITGAVLVGGLIGENDGDVATCSAQGIVTDISDAGSDIGGLIGLNNVTGQVTSSFATGTITGHQNVGGLSGENGGDITQCYAFVDVVGREQVGGLVGWNFSGTLSRCFSNGDIQGDTRVGGLVGDNSGLCFHICSAGGTIVDCYSNAAVTGRDTVGGLAGSNGGYRLGDEGSISHCYASGMIQSHEGSNIGGLTGFGWASSSFWDVQSSGLFDSEGGEGKTTAEMKTAVIFIEAGWDVADPTDTETVWYLSEGTDYPRFQWELE